MLWFRLRASWLLQSCMASLGDLLHVDLSAELKMYSMVPISKFTKLSLTSIILCREVLHVVPRAAFWG